MHSSSTNYIRLFVVIVIILSAFVLGYPIAFVVQHGFNPSGWPPELVLTPFRWFSEWSVSFGSHYPNVLLFIGTYLEMLLSRSPAFYDGGLIAWAAICGSAAFLGASAATLLRTERTTVHGDAKWASRRILSHMRVGLEIGQNPDTGRPVRIQVEGNLLTIAPPRTGKTDGLILPNLAWAEREAWAGPAVVIDPKGDAYRATKRRRQAMGRTVRCLDPLDLVGGTDRWNPLARVDVKDVLYLMSMASALAPQVNQQSDGGAFFNNGAAILIAAAAIVSTSDGRPNLSAASELLLDEKKFHDGLMRHQNEAHAASKLLANALRILDRDDPKTRSNLFSTANQNMQWLHDQRMQATVQNSTFDLTDLADGNVDLFIVLPADSRKHILAPYVRWLLADLFAAVRQQRPCERIIAFIDEASILGPFRELLDAAGELPGYGLSIWTFWQSRSQIETHYGRSGAEIFLDTAEMVNLFNLSAVRPDETERWSLALGTYTGTKLVLTEDVKSKKASTSRDQEPLRLVPAADLPRLLNEFQIVFLNGLRHTPYPLKLKRTAAHLDSRIACLLDLKAPVGSTTAN